MRTCALPGDVDWFDLVEQLPDGEVALKRRVGVEVGPLLVPSDRGVEREPIVRYLPDLRRNRCAELDTVGRELRVVETPTRPDVGRPGEVVDAWPDFFLEPVAEES